MKLTNSKRKAPVWIWITVIIAIIALVWLIFSYSSVPPDDKNIMTPADTIQIDE